MPSMCWAFFFSSSSLNKCNFIFQDKCRIIIIQQKSEVLLSEGIMKASGELRNYNFPYPISKSNETWTGQGHRSEALGRYRISLIAGESSTENMAQHLPESDLRHSPFLPTVDFAVPGGRKVCETVMNSTSCKVTCVSDLWAKGPRAAGAGFRDLPLGDRPWPLTQDSGLRGIKRRLAAISACLLREREALRHRRTQFYGLQRDWQQREKMLPSAHQSLAILEVKTLRPGT